MDGMTRQDHIVRSTRFMLKQVVQELDRAANANPKRATLPPGDTAEKRFHAIAECLAQRDRMGEVREYDHGHTFASVASVDMKHAGRGWPLTAGSTRGLVDGFEHEVAVECARQWGEPYDERKPYIPYLCMLSQRDLTVASASGGGYLVDTNLTDQVVELLRSMSTVIALGAQTEVGLVGNLTIARQTAASTATWLATEATAATPSAQVLGQTAGSPKNLVTASIASHLLMRQAGPRLASIPRQMLRTVMQTYDAACIAGATHGPNGLLGAIDTSGDASTWSGVQAMRKFVSDANVDESALQWLGNPKARQYMSGVEKSVGSGRFLWENNLIDGVPARVSTNVPLDGSSKGQVILGDWTTNLCMFWGPGVAIELDPLTDFRTGKVAWRAWLAADHAVLQPSAFQSADALG